MSENWNVRVFLDGNEVRLLINQQYPRENAVKDALQTTIVVEEADGIHILLFSEMWISC